MKPIPSGAYSVIIVSTLTERSSTLETILSDGGCYFKLLALVGCSSKVAPALSDDALLRA